MSVPRETVEEEDSLFTLTLNAMRSLDEIAVPIDHLRVSQIGVEGGPVTYLTPENRGVVLLHPRDWPRVWTEATQSGLFGLAAARPATGGQEIWGVPVKIDGEEQRPRPTPPREAARA